MADQQRPTSSPTPAGPPGYVIRPPQPSAPPPTTATPTAPSSSAPALTTRAPGITLREPTVLGGLTQNGAIVGAAILVGLALVFFLLRGAVRNHLISNKASLSSAGGASWALFCFLIVAAFTVVFGLVGQLWTVWAFTVPLGALSLITLILFIVMYNSATRMSR